MKRQEYRSTHFLVQECLPEEGWTGSRGDGRRPEGVRFATPRQDALRRDFTINGMFYDPVTKKVIDYVGGRKDLDNGVIRTIGSPGERFAEDYLRMIRAVRFAVRLCFRIAPATARAVREHAHNIVHISGERVFDELWKMLAHKSGAQALRAMDKLGLAQQVLPELFEQTDLWQVATTRVNHVAKMQAATLALGAMMADLPPKTIRKIAGRWGASNDLRDELIFYSKHLAGWRAATELALCDFKRLIASPHFGHLRTLWRFEERRLTGKESHTRQIARRAGGIPKDKIAPPPLLTGADLMGMGLREGPRLGQILRAVYNAQLNEVIRSPKEAQAMARELIET
ncbi:MAG: hypothetical protein SVT52_03855 [Planctomycetota bacterium]|nr:hypothetical protein [Planctomycetota bacterium]